MSCEIGSLFHGEQLGKNICGCLRLSVANSFYPKNRYFDQSSSRAIVVVDGHRLLPSP